MEMNEYMSAMSKAQKEDEEQTHKCYEKHIGGKRRVIFPTPIGDVKTSIYDRHGSWARWEIREIDHLLKCVKEGTRTEEDVWKRFLEIVRGEKHR